MMLHRQRSSATLTVVAAALLSTTACKAPQAFGDRHSVIVRADPALWQEVEPFVMGTLEQRVFTTRPERTFKVTFVAAGDTLWNQLRLWHQVLVLGTQHDEVVRRLIDKSEPPEAQAPAILQARDVWARTQLVSVLLLPAEGQAEAVRAMLPELFSLLMARYDEWVVERMYTSGLNEALIDSLGRFGFALQLPKVYLFARQDSVFRFGNPYRQGDSDLLRSVLLTWRADAAGATAESLRDWRESIDEVQYTLPQDILDEGLRLDSVSVGGLAALELRGVWQDRAEFPAAGPFVARAIACPSQDRTYYMDAWVFAPGKDKYPYLRQLEILLDSFRCSRGGQPASSAAATTG